MLEDDETINAMEAAPPGAVARWVPAAVVLTAVGGFIALAWYAYHAGTQSINEEGLLVVEADHTPMKEKPEDPGGMKFPNQDKTIFETFGNAPQPANVERVLPAPEEPMPRNLDTSQTTTWVKPTEKPEPPKQETVIGSPKSEPKKDPAPAKASDPGISSYTAKAPAKTQEKAAATVPPDKQSKTRIIAAPMSSAPTKTGAYMAQLGAYRSDNEARTAWKSLRRKYAPLAGMQPIIVQADLGAKGIYYRLRVGGFSSSDGVRTFCAGLKGQACIAVQ